MAPLKEWVGVQAEGKREKESSFGVNIHLFAS